MARIVGPASGHATLTGTSGDDLILANGDANTISGGGGNDTIQALSGNDNSIVVGALSDGETSFTDIIRLGGLGDTVRGGDENVRLVGQTSNSTVTLGHGSDTVSLIGAADTLSFGGGSDTIRALGGNDRVLFSGQSAPGYIDAVTLDGAHNEVDNTLTYGAYPAIGVLDVTGGSGDGRFLLGTTGGTIVTHGTGNYIEGGEYGTKIVAGSGYDTVNLVAGTRDTGGEASVLLAGNHNLVTGVEGDATITGGQGYDTIDLLAQAAGEQVLHITDGGTHDVVGVLAANATIDGGSSYETVTAISSVVTMTFAGHADALYLEGPEQNAGVPTATVDDLSPGLNIYLEPQASGEYAPPFENLVVDGFDSTGVIDFVGGRGGFTSTSQIAADLHSTGSGDYTLALADNSGTITFINAGHLTASNFRLT